MSPRQQALVRTIPCLAIALLVGCRSQPQIDVEAAKATPVPPAAELAQAPPIAPGAEMPPGHPPVDGAAPPADGTTMPPGHPQVGSPADAVQAVAGTVVPGGQGDKAIAWAAPKAWVSEPPANNMRRAQYRIPGLRGDAECVVFYFGPGQGGDPKSNAERWSSQFVNADGTPATAAMKTRAVEANGMKVLYVETRGTYLAGMMAGGQAEQKPGFALLGAIVEGPDANWFFKLTGPASTVDAQRAGFESMIGAMKRGG